MAVWNGLCGGFSRQVACGILHVEGMRMLMRFGEHLVDIQIEETRRYYQAKMPENDCECPGCENFRRFADACDSRIPQAFAALGVENMRQIYEIIPYHAERAQDDAMGGNPYGGFFPVVDTIVSESAVNPENSTRRVTDSFALRLSDHISLMPEDFPSPMVQIEMWATLPWLLPCENPYLR